MSNNSKYTSSNIKALKGLEPVRKRPGMYIGSTDTNGLHHLIWEIVDNSIDEALANFASEITVRLKNDKSIEVEDNGRGIPIDVHKESGKTGVELIFTELHTGGKFSDSGVYKTAGGLHGVGASVVNALSTRVEATCYKDGKEYITIFGQGNIIQNTKMIGTTSKKGTKVKFWPEYPIFKNAKISREKVIERLRESSYLISGLKIRVVVESDFRKKDEDKVVELYSKNGIEDFVAFANESKTPLSKVYSYKGTKEEIEVEIGFQYTNDYSENIISFVNNIKTREGGSHVAGFKNAWTKLVNDFASQNKLLKSKKKLDGEDIREGLTCILSLKIPEKLLEFVGQTKDSLRTLEARKAVEEVVNEKLKFWLVESKKEAIKIINKSLTAAKAREAARKARSEVRKLKKTLGQKLVSSDKLTKAQSRKPEELELFLVEGDSAGGSAKMGRDRKYQAILPLRGKVINTERAKLINILNNEEVSTIINTIGAGVSNEFDVKKINYHKIIIMTDADTDGAHIQTLLLTFLFRYMKPLIENGNTYIAVPPLYKLTVNGSSSKKIEKYAWDENELKELTNKYKGGYIQRFKGLGEMNADQLWDTTMNPETRKIIKVNITDPIIVERRVSTLMGENVEPRKKWINENVDFSLEDDFEF